MNDNSAANLNACRDASVKSLLMVVGAKTRLLPAVFRVLCESTVGNVSGEAHITRGGGAHMTIRAFPVFPFEP